MTAFDELEGSGWVAVEPPHPSDDMSIIARYKGEPVHAGLQMSSEVDDGVVTSVFRTGMYDVTLKLDETSGTAQLKVEEADGY